MGGGLAEEGDRKFPCLRDICVGPHHFILEFTLKIFDVLIPTRLRLVSATSIIEELRFIRIPLNAEVFFRDIPQRRYNIEGEDSCQGRLSLNAG